MAYAIAALVGGVFYREFTKRNSYTGVTALEKVHVHLLVLGTSMFLITAAIMRVVRGIIHVLNLNISKAISASISGIAGIGYILLGTGLTLLLVTT